ncbi:MAG: four helix bundle protein [Cytophagaceae bacterium]|nr:four helix bundle protein [Cytophagaceae bacterium]
MTNQRKNIIVEKTFSFSLKCIELYKFLINNKEYTLSKQLLRSATSIGANVEEALAAQSKKDFISKMSIASKEARETKYWIRLLTHSQIVEYDYNPYLQEIDEIIRILTSIVKSAQENTDSSAIQNSKFKIQN